MVILSVVIPAYNAEKYLKRCIDSVEKSLENARATADSEVIVINDGSKDRTSDICIELQNEYANVKIINLDDQGVSAARNAGLKIATGKYIGFVDADDVVDIDMFEKLLSIAEMENADIVGCGFLSWDGKEPFDTSGNRNDNRNDSHNGNHNGNENSSENGIAHEYDLYSPIEFIEKQFLVNNTRCWSKIYRKDTIADVIFKEGLTIGEDMLFLLQAVKKSAAIVEFKEYRGYGYYRNPIGAIERPFTPKYMDQILCWKLVREELAGLFEDNANNGNTNNRNTNDRCSEIEQITISKLIVGIMLVVSKIAMTNTSAKNTEKDSAKEAVKQNLNYVNICHEEIKNAIRECPEAVSCLDRGYKFKTCIFKNFPKLYMKLYGLWKA